MRRNSFFIKYGDRLVLFLLPLFFVFHGFVDNYPSVLFKDAAYLLMVYELAVFTYAYLFTFLLKDRIKASLFTFLAFCLFFFFGPLHDFIKQIFAESIFAKYSFILPVILVTASLGFYKIKKSNKSFFKIFTFFFLLLSTLLLFDAFVLTFSKIGQTRQVAQLPSEFQQCDTCNKPDIYLIVADEYAGAQELKEVMNFDNAPFENELKNLGFHIIKNSKSNYNYTPYSIASLLNMDYLPKLKGYNSYKYDQLYCYQRINNNAFLGYLKAAGYNFSNYSVFSVDNLQPIKSSLFFGTSRELLTTQTLFGKVYKDLKFKIAEKARISAFQDHLKFGQLEANELYIANTINEAVINDSHPKFVYTHLIMPHYPYYYDSTGQINNDIDFSFTTSPNTRKAYLSNLQHANEIFISLIKNIISKSKREPIIIFMSDHGYREQNLEFEKKFQFMNINAVYLPNKRYEGFYEGLSNVNQFRVLLNSQFNLSLPLLKDSTIFLNE